MVLATERSVPTQETSVLRMPGKVCETRTVKLKQKQDRSMERMEERRYRIQFTGSSIIYIGIVHMSSTSRLNRTGTHKRGLCRRDGEAKATAADTHEVQDRIHEARGDGIERRRERGTGERRMRELEGTRAIGGSGARSHDIQYDTPSGEGAILLLRGLRRRERGAEAPL